VGAQLDVLGAIIGVSPTLTVTIKMSDSMQSFTIGQFAGATSRVVSAYQTLVNIQQALQPVYC
jgi:hypothetical protein